MIGDKIELFKQLSKSALAVNVTLTEKQLEMFFQYAELIREWNKKFNLTAVSEDEIAVLHFTDSLSLLKLIEHDSSCRLLDIGSGAGFPGIPLKIACPDLEVTLLDSSRKRVDFLRMVGNRLNLKGYTTIHGRAEDLARQDQFREGYQIVTARAVAVLGELCELAIPFCEVSGRFIAMKGPGAEDEIAESRELIQGLGAIITDCKHFKIPGGHTRALVSVLKKTETDPKYPRSRKKIGNTP